VAGVSGGPQTEHDVALATLLAQAFDAHLTLVHVLSQVPLLYMGIWNPAQVSADERLARVEPAIAYLRQASARLTAAGVAHDLVVRSGLVQDELLAVVAGDYGQPRGDLMVIGAHARSSGTGMDYYEDIAGQVTRAAPVSTLVVHAESDWSHWSAARIPRTSPVEGVGPRLSEQSDNA
jgi:nucleotide-binding universal stress UspA family protein